MRAEHARDVALALPDRAEVPEQRAQRAALDPHVGPEEVLAVEVEERAPDGDLRKRDAALVSRGRPGVLALPVVRRQRRGERRQQPLDVALDRGRDPAAHERGVSSSSHTNSSAIVATSMVTVPATFRSAMRKIGTLALRARTARRRSVASSCDPLVVAVPWSS